MTRNKILLVCFVVLIGIAGFAGRHYFQGIPPKANEAEVAYIKSGDVWVINLSNRKENQLTFSEGKVDNFLFSPDRKYLAYTQILKTDYVGMDGTMRFDTTEINIMNLGDGKIIKKIIPDSASGVPALGTWASNNKLFFYTHGAFDVGNFLEYDLVLDSTSTQSIAGIKSESTYVPFSEFDISSDGTLIAYIDELDRGVKNIRVASVLTGKEEDGIRSPGNSPNLLKFSLDKKKLALIDVRWGTSGADRTDNLWVYDFTEKQWGEIWQTPAEGMTNTSKLLWSPNGRYIAFAPVRKIFIIDLVDKKTIVTLPESESANWSPDGKLIFSRGKNIYIRDINTSKDEIIIPNGEQPFVL